MYNPKLHFHFVGIGGVGMSGIAEVLVRMGFSVSGSDIKYNDACQRLERLGVTVKIGHSAENITKNVSLIVYSSAVDNKNPEIIYAKNNDLPVIRRAEVLAELMRLKFSVGVAGSHGKTTTTSFISAILEVADRDPTVIIGGKVHSFGSCGKLGKGDILVAETDESDRSFLLLSPTIAIVTNIDAEHLSAYRSFEHLKESFLEYIQSVPFYGLAVLCADDKTVFELGSQYGRRKLFYGLSERAELRAVDIVNDRGYMSFNCILRGESLGKFDLPTPGAHMVTNSLAAIGVALEFGIPVEVIKQALKNFSGVGRRLEVMGEPNNILFLNDYGHHPTEVKATIDAVKESYGYRNGKFWVIFQPHRYTRTRDCFGEFLLAFKNSDKLVVTEIYSAGEQPIAGITGETLCNAIIHPDKKFVRDFDILLATITNEFSPGDVVLCLGAGSIGTLPDILISKLQSVHEQNSLASNS